MILTTVVGERQAPLRAVYAEDPEKARIVKRVRSGPAGGGDPLHGSVVPENLADPEAAYGVAWRYGIDSAVGGLHDAPNPGEMLCGALAACTDSTIRMIADLLGAEIDELTVEVSGDLDVRGSLNIDRSVPVGFERLAVEIDLRAAPGTSERLVQTVVAGAEQFCVVLDTLRRGVPVEITVDSAPSERTDVAGSVA